MENILNPAMSEAPKPFAEPVFVMPEDAERRRTRPEETRGEKLLMSFAAAAGIAAGIAAVLTGAADKTLPRALAEIISAGFGAVFFRRILVLTASLAAEFLLGFFAFGDILVWSVPMFIGLGAGAAFAAEFRAAFLPTAGIAIACGVIGAAWSGKFSAMLRNAATGRSARAEKAPAKSFAARFGILFAAALLTSIAEGIISQTVR